MTARMPQHAGDHRVAPDVTMQVGAIDAPSLAAAVARPMQAGNVSDAVGGAAAPSIVERPAHPDDRARLGRNRGGHARLVLQALPLLRHEKARAQRGEEQRVLADDGVAIFRFGAARRRHQGDRIAVRLGGAGDGFAGRAIEARASRHAGLGAFGFARPAVGGVRVGGSGIGMKIGGVSEDAALGDGKGRRGSQVGCHGRMLGLMG